MSEELFTRKESSKDLLNIIKDKLRLGLFLETMSDFDKIIEMEFECPEIYANMACVKFWINRIDTINRLNGKNLEIASYLSTCYVGFLKFIDRREFGKDILAITAIHYYVYSKVVRCLKDEDCDRQENVILLGHALMELQDYEQALRVFDKFRGLEPYNGVILSHISEIYYRLGHVQKAKMYLRDALFYAPLDVPFGILSTTIVLEIRGVIEKRGLHNASEESIKLWMSAYSELLNILDVKRKFYENEELTLRRVISKLEADYRHAAKRTKVAPRLLAAYAWLTTGLIMNRNEKDSEEISILGRKMALIDKDLLEYYIKLLELKR